MARERALRPGRGVRLLSSSFHGISWDLRKRIEERARGGDALSALHAVEPPGCIPSSGRASWTESSLPGAADRR